MAFYMHGCAGHAPVTVTPAPQIRLLIQGDDMGALHGINLGMVEAHKNGIMTVTEVIVPGPWLPEAIAMLKENPGIDVGIHLCLTSEWVGVRWRPLTGGKTIRDPDGYFFHTGGARPDRFPPGHSLVEAKPDIKEVEAELRAQIELLKKHLPRLSHISLHMGAANETPEMKDVVARLRKEYALDVDTSGVKPVPVDFGKDNTGMAPEKRIELFADALEKIGPGTWRFAEHPATGDPEMQAVYHKGYENVAYHRQAILKMWTDGKIKEIVRRRGIKLIGYCDLKVKP